MTWTTKKPSRPGWYWHRAAGESPEVVDLTSISQDTDLWMSYAGFDDGGYVSDRPDSDEWSSEPLEPPKEGP